MYRSVVAVGLSLIGLVDLTTCECFGDELRGRWVLKDTKKGRAKVQGAMPTILLAVNDGSAYGGNRRFRYELRPGCTPNEIDLTTTSDWAFRSARRSPLPKKWFGVYSVDANGLTLCLSSEPDDRPDQLGSFDLTQPRCKNWIQYHYERKEETVDAGWEAIRGEWRIGRRVNSPVRRWELIEIHPNRPFQNEAKIEIDKGNLARSSTGTIHIDSTRVPHRIWGTISVDRKYVPVSGFYKLNDGQMTIVLGTPPNVPKTWKVERNSPFTLFVAEKVSQP